MCVQIRATLLAQSPLQPLLLPALVDASMSETRLLYWNCADNDVCLVVNPDDTSDFTMLTLQQSKTSPDSFSAIYVHVCIIYMME